MKQYYLALLFLLFFSSLFSQPTKIRFHYKNEVIEGVLKTSLNQLRNQITIKDSSGKQKIYKIDSMTDVVIDGVSYYSGKVSFDPNLNKNAIRFDYTSDPNYIEDYLLLKILVNGDHSLYQYSSSIFSQFYYTNTIKKTPEALVFKEYYVGQNTVKKNNRFQRQLSLDAPFDGYRSSDYSILKYESNNLIRYFNKLNGYEMEENTSTSKFYLSLFGGVANSNFEGKYPQPEFIVSITGYDGFKLENKATIYIGVSGEITIDNKGKNALFIDAAYNKYAYNSRIESTINNRTENISFREFNFNYMTHILHFNFGYKRYYSINMNSQFYLSGSFNVALIFNSENTSDYKYILRLRNGSETLKSDTIQGDKATSNTGARIGMGYLFKKHYFIELNHRKELFRKDVDVFYSMSTLSLGYRF